MVCRRSEEGRKGETVTLESKQEKVLRKDGRNTGG